jgi:hypothetical protein
MEPMPADFQVALPTEPMGIHPAPCALGDPRGALGDQREGRDGPHATPTLASWRRTVQRRLPREAMELIIHTVCFTITTHAIRRTRLGVRACIADAQTRSPGGLWGNRAHEGQGRMPAGAGRYAAEERLPRRPCPPHGTRGSRRGVAAPPRSAVQTTGPPPGSHAATVSRQLGSTAEAPRLRGWSSPFHTSGMARPRSTRERRTARQLTSASARISTPASSRIIVV